MTLNIPLEDALVRVTEHFELGTVQDFSVMLTGYSNLNVHVNTEQGSYMAKFFADSRTIERNVQVIETMVAYQKAGVPIPRVLKATSDPVLRMDKRSGAAFVNVLEFFDGEDFDSQRPSRVDLLNVISAVAAMHNTSITFARFYNDWGAANIVTEYSSTASSLKADGAKLVEQAISDFSKVDTKHFRRCTIHGDLHRSNVLKSSDNKYCLIDFGCVDYSYAILDVAAFLAWCCFDGVDAFEEMQDLYRLVLAQYLKSRELSCAELTALPTFIRAVYAAFHMASSQLLANGDTRGETGDWNTKSLAGLRKSNLINALHFG